MSTLKNMLTAVEASQRSWQDTIGEIQIALNSTVSRVTKFSPLELSIGKEARPFGLLATDNNMSVNREDIRNKAANNMYQSACYEKMKFDKTKMPVVNFKIGDFVLFKNEERHQTKLDPKYKGPFKVAEVLDGDRYVLKSLSNNRSYKYAHEHLRKLPDGQSPEEFENLDNDNENENENVERDVSRKSKKDIMKHNENNVIEQNENIEIDVIENKENVEKEIVNDENKI